MLLTFVIGGPIFAFILIYKGNISVKGKVYCTIYEPDGFMTQGLQKLGVDADFNVIKIKEELYNLDIDAMRTYLYPVRPLPRLFYLRVPAISYIRGVKEPLVIKEGADFMDDEERPRFRLSSSGSASIYFNKDLAEVQKSGDTFLGTGGKFSKEKILVIASIAGAGFSFLALYMLWKQSVVISQLNTLLGA